MVSLSVEPKWLAGRSKAYDLPTYLTLSAGKASAFLAGGQGGGDNAGASDLQ